MKKHWSKKLEKFSPCSEAMEWLQTQPAPEVAWAVCPDGSWMLWLLGRLSGKPGSVKRKRLALAACDCASAASAAYAVYAAYAAASAAYASAAADAARSLTLKQCAKIVRKHYPKPPVI
jgi:hypothetical protein